MKQGKDVKPEITAAISEQYLKEKSNEKYVLRLYVTGLTPKSQRAIKNIKNICEEHLQGRYDLEVTDIYKHPALAQGEQIITTPTLIKKRPLPLQSFIGDLSNT